MKTCEKIRMYRKRKGFTQKQLGNKLNVSAAAISQFEKQENIQIETIKKIADALECNVTELLGEEFGEMTVNKTAKEMFEELGFKKNKSICFNDKWILYERESDKGCDLLTIEFKNGYYVYTSSLRCPMKTYKAVHLAIHQQLLELGWL